MKSDALLSSNFESLYPDTTRFDQIEQILRFVKEGKSCQVIGLPGAGRGNILGFLAYNKAIRQKHLGDTLSSFHFVLVNFTELRKRSLYDTTKFFFLALLDSFRERKMQNIYDQVNAIFKESVAIHDELVLFHGLKRVIDLLAIEKQLTIVLLFDHFEEYIPMLTPEFFTNLRVLRNRAKYHFSVVFSVNRPLEETLEPTLFADFHEFFANHIVYLPLLDKPGIDFRIAYLEKITEKKIDKKLLENVLHLTGGHMKLTRVALETILATSSRHSGEKQRDDSRISNHDERSWTSQDDELSHFLLSQKTIHSALYEIWNYLTPAEQTHLAKRLFGKEYLDEHTTMLTQLHLLKDETVLIPLFETFVQTEFKDKQVGKESIVFDQNANDIKKGTAVLSDKLTSSEFKLLRFLIQNTEKVVERNDIVNAVWGDAKSTAGVTDQALDQLIFRLRKKIEDDPNNPTHLQTVKGRGFKFMQ